MGKEYTKVRREKKKVCILLVQYDIPKMRELFKEGKIYVHKDIYCNINLQQWKRMTFLSSCSRALKALLSSNLRMTAFGKANCIMRFLSSPPSAVDPQTTQVWTARVRYMQIFFNSKYYSTTDPRLVESEDEEEARIQRAHCKVTLGFWTTGHQCP